VKINIPHMLIGLRELGHHARPSRWERFGYRLWREILQRPLLYQLALRFARLALRLRSNGGWLKKLPGPGRNWTASRDFPAPAPRSFREMWREL
jgi:L-lactate dehydrogenase complex protein LldF